MIYKLLASQIQPGGLPNTTKEIGNTEFTTVLSIVFAILGALAFLVIVIAGLRYITAAGDPQKTAQAKNTIVYALIGLVVAISANAIVAFVARGVL